MVTWGAGNPGQAKGAAAEVPIRENICQTEVVVIELRVEIQEIGDIDVRRTELIGLPLVSAITGRRVVDLQPLNDKLEAIDVFEDRRLVDMVHGFDVLGDERCNLLSSLGVRRLVLLDVIPEVCIGLYV